METIRFDSLLYLGRYKLSLMELHVSQLLETFLTRHHILVHRSSVLLRLVLSGKCFDDVSCIPKHKSTLL